MNNSILFDTDSYKVSHWLQYPPGTEKVFLYLEARGGHYPATLFFGLQYYLKRYLQGSIVTMEDVERAKEFYAVHGEPFHYEGWKRIVEVHGGRLPLSIHAVPEGSIVPTSNVLFTVENTDPECYWLPGWVETILMRTWYPITVTTRSRFLREKILSYLIATSDDPQTEITFKLHDFGSRGVSSRESAMIGGAAHLVNFFGSDTVIGIQCANYFYNHEMAGYSIPAAEHSTITSWGREHECDAYRNMLRNFAKPGALVAVVSDSYDIYAASANLWGGELKEEVINSGAVVIVRPDSGHPTEVLPKLLGILEERFGTTLNSRGFRVLNHVRTIWGDGIDEVAIGEILDCITSLGYSATNIAFGMGGGLLQQVNRDTVSFAMKCSSILVQGEERDVYKSPIDSHGKASKKGRLDLVRTAEGYRTVKLPSDAGDSSLVEVFRDGEILKEYSLGEIRERANSEPGISVSARTEEVSEATV